MNLYLLITALAIFGGFLKVAQIVLSGKPEHSEADSANSPDVKSPFPAIQLGGPDISNTSFDYNDTFYCTNINHKD